MLHAKLGETMLRVMPPGENCAGFAQDGEVVEITDTHITLNVQVDVQRKMKFSRFDGRDTAGMGSFLVRSPFLSGGHDASKEGERCTRIV